ncbi:hypothetical protein LEP1GSC199_0113 [Leptospira vanthielii serovar Holland str. Waz Holland = ATCC 700522]|uniref:Uncharacterized protein n=1 Tax=Leptospira vanthielii serovar Holland str. Waz Holland = ATCC 700522 TaxID=1218591 RepID=N1VV37_9LEPT|nr:hypothetical protein LEP1GSC199_0113 [Leptospira vanthielii serovar Holland str. Waz Holland = ATCC 700522]
MEKLRNTISELNVNHSGRKVCISFNLKDGKTLNLSEFVDHNIASWLHNSLLQTHTKDEDVLNYSIIFV